MMLIQEVDVDLGRSGWRIEGRSLGCGKARGQRRDVCVFGGEHFVRRVRGAQCAALPRECKHPCDQLRV